MKKIVLGIFILLGFYSNAQDVKAQIEGISIFKIDKTNIKIIDSLANNGYNLKTCKDTYDCSKYKISGMNIYEMINDTIQPDSQLPLFKEYRKFIIAQYTVAGIEITEMQLSFYNDVLFSINISGDLRLSMALKEKYNGEIKVDKNEVTCTSRLGDYKEEEVCYTTIYRENEKFKAYSTFKIYYNDKCEKNTLNYTLIHNKETYKLVYSKNEAAKVKIDEKLKIKKISELDKL